MRGHELRELVEELEVVGERCADVRALHLDDDLAAAAQRGGVHLAEARGAERLVVEVVEQLADAAAELLLDRLLDVVERDRADVVLQRSSSRMYGSREQVGRVEST